MADYIQGLKKNIKTGNIKKAKTALKQISSRYDHEKLEIIQILALAPDETAFELLSFLTDITRHDPQIHDRLIQLITDRAHLNSHFAMILLDKTDTPTIKHIVPLLKHILLKETNAQLLNKILRTAGKIKIKRMVDEIAEFIFYDDVDLKTEAVKALERIGTSKACAKLVAASKTSKCDQNILDAIEVLAHKDLNNMVLDDQLTRDGSSDGPLIDINQLVSKDIEKRFKALAYFSEQGPKTCLSLLKHLETIDINKNHDLTINILRLIARTIPAEAINALFDIINIKGIDNTIKFTAYNSLGAFPELESAASVIQGLSESAMFVRMAAIKTLDKNLSDFVGSEIKNQIESGTKKGELLAHSILDARAKNIIKFLMISDTFSYMASNYIARSASLQTLDAFIEILEQRKLKSTAKKYLDLRKTKTGQQKTQFIVISSSDAVLDTYSRLIYSCGFSNLCFQHSQDAFEAIVSQKPGAILCDLILNNMTGLEFANEIRQMYAKEDVPIVLSTLQKNLNKTQLQEMSDYSGINGIYQFPAKPAQIKSWIKS
ncbi:MAG: response regulator [Desulfobacula sp.]|nr:response regulator [Desulfobacula sp.]